MTKKNYRIDELQIPKNYEKMPLIDQQKIATDFNEKKEVILNRLKINSKNVALHEKEFLYFKENKNILLNDYYEIFKDFYFVNLYEKYRTNLETEHKVHVDFNGLDLEILNNHFSNLDLNDIEKFFNEWKKNVINNPKNHGKSDLPNSIKKEIKKQLDKYYEEDENKSKKLTDATFKLNCEYCLLILHSKWVYLLTEKIIATYNNYENYYELNLNENKIRFTITSLVHILIRHYGLTSKIAKSYKDEEECSNHNKNVHFEEIHIILETIFNEINNSKILKNSYIENLLKTKRDEDKFISFQYKETIYKAYFKINKNENESKKNTF